jgi:MSHA biogenesis protein MshO
MRLQKGFTLIELIIVIVLLAIVAGFSFQFVGIGAQMFATGAERLQTLEKSRFAIERLTREIRGAVPNSVRVMEQSNVQCLEFVPILAAGTYYDTPVQSYASDTMTFVTFDSNWALNGGERVFIYATRANFIYPETSERYAKLLGRGEPTGVEYTLTLNSGSQFAKESPLSRAYVGTQPVSFCVDLLGNLYRVSGYEWQTEQKIPSSGFIRENLIATDINIGAAAFDVATNNQQSHNIISLQLQFGENAEEQVFYYREVHIPNAP